MGNLTPDRERVSDTRGRDYGKRFVAKLLPVESFFGNIQFSLEFWSKIPAYRNSTKKLLSISIALSKI